MRRMDDLNIDSLFDSLQVNIPAESGEMGVLANHVPSIEQLKPGMVEIIEESGGNKQFFCGSSSLSHPHALLYTNHPATLALEVSRSHVSLQALYAQLFGYLESLTHMTLTVCPLVSGGFAIVQPGSQLSINAVEGYPIEDFSKDVSEFSYDSKVFGE